MTRLVDQYDRERAKRDATNLLRHQLNRIWDAQQEVQEKIDGEDLDGVINATGKLSSLISKAQQLAQIWKGFVLDWQRGEEAAKAQAITEASPEVTLEPERQEAPSTEAAGA